MGNSFGNGSNESLPSLHSFGEFSFDSEKRTLWRHGELVYLTPRTADLLNALLERRGQIVERNELVELVWKDAIVEEGNLSYTVSRLRKIVGTNGAGEPFIQTIPRRGYRFVEGSATHHEIEFKYEKRSETVIQEIHITSEPTRPPWLTALSGYPIGRIALGLVAVVALTAIIAGTIMWKYGDSGAARPPQVSSLAVLPFRTLEADHDKHRGLGLADVLITRLSGLKEITVRPTSEVMGLEDREFDSIEVGKNLQVDAVLYGMIYRTGETVRVNARLTRVSDGATLWSGVLEKPLAEESSIENDIVVQLVDALSLTSDRASARPYTNNPDAYQLYVSGRYEWNKRNAPSLQDAKRLFRDAIAVDPNFALAYVGLADSLVMNDSATPELNSLIAKAIELDPNLGEPYATLGFSQTVHKWDWRAAEQSFKKSIELKPGYVTAHHWYAILLGIEGRTAEAKSEMQKALIINPGSYNLLADLGQLYYFDRDYAKAEEYCKRALDIYPDFSFAHGYLEQIYWMTGKHELAIDEMVASRVTNERVANAGSGESLAPDYTTEYYRRPYESGGVKGLVDFLIASAEKQPAAIDNPNTSYRHAILHMLAGEKEKALANLNDALERRAFFMVWVKADPVFDGLRSEPRYQEMLRKMEL